MDIAQQLVQSPLGHDWTLAEAEDFAAAAHRRSVVRGAYLFCNGDTSSSLFVVVEGSFDVVLEKAGFKDTVVAQVTAGQIVGELEAMTHSLRAASLVAKEDSVVLELPNDTFDAMVSENRPVASKLMRTIAVTLARRLAAVNQQILAKAPPKPVEPKPVEPVNIEPVEVSDDDLIAPIEDDDLDVLDKIWS